MEIIVKLVCLSTLLTLVLASYSFQDDLIVETNFGKLQGKDLDVSYAFLGIPFAKPPVGDLRFQDPRPPNAWPGIRDATLYSAGCTQECHEPPDACPLEVDEDCLYLNIWVPKTNRSAPLYPVLIFMHGGNFKDGSGTALLYDSRFLANEADAIIVTINYRMEVFGWAFIGPVYDVATGKTETIVNEGLRDQQLAFMWIKDNIEYFGGDKTKVTISGQSAGAQSVGVHLLSDISESLFDQALMFSNPFTLPLKTFEDGFALATEVAKLLGCQPTDLTCLRSVGQWQLLAASREASSKSYNNDELLQIFEPWSPGVGEYTELKEEIIIEYQEGRVQRKPTMLGTTREEGLLYIHGLFRNPLGNLPYRLFMRAIFRDKYRDVISKYPVDNSVGADQRNILSDTATDYVFHCAVTNISREMANNGYDKYYHYIFDTFMSFDGEWGENLTMCEKHVCHAGDLAYIFRTAPLGDRDPPLDYTFEEYTMMDQMSAYISNFLHTGDPNKAGTPELEEKHKKLPGRKYYWPKIAEKPGHYYSMYYNGNCGGNSVLTDYRREWCKLWDEIGYYKFSPLNKMIDPISKDVFEDIFDGVFEEEMQNTRSKRCVCSP